uniref:Putative ovule protein n=1 Tax=Solanum chacoense TaxID=4108 RepID=A0A0V0H171_SOLCH
MLKILYRSKLPDSFSILQDLETLHIETQENIDPMIISRDISLPNLKKLKLCLTRIPWEVVNLLANLPNLEVLNGNCAFVGTDWKVDEDIVFHKLKYLRLSHCCDLERWEAAGSDNFPVLEQLILDKLYRLEEIPESIGEIMTLKFIRIIWCGSDVETSAKKIQQEQESLGNYELQLQITPMLSHVWQQQQQDQQVRQVQQRYFSRSEH